jgi:hypothetical protein
MRAAFGVIVYSRRKRDAVVYAAFALSLVLHALLMLGWLPLRSQLGMSSLGNPEAGKRGGHGLPLAVRIATRATTTSEQAVAPSPPPVPRARAALRAESAPKAAPRVLHAENARATATIRLPPLAAARPGSGGDFMADLGARRGAREQAEHKDQGAPAPNSALSFGVAPGPGGELQDGGVFRIERMTPYDATLAFYRVNRYVQRVEVGVGSNLSIQLAVIRQVIAVMRDSGFTGEVTWMSERFGHTVQLSLRERDATQLEAFLMLEFFSADPIRRPPDTAGTR